MAASSRPFSATSTVPGLPGLKAAMQPLFSADLETDFVDRKHDVYETTEKRHGRTDECETWESLLDISNHPLHAETLAAKPQGLFYGQVVGTSSNLALAWLAARLMLVDRS